MTKWYRITKKHSVYGNDLKSLSSAIKYREKELLDYPIEAMGKEISIDTLPPHLKNTSRLLLSNYVDYFKQIYFIVAFINEHYKNKNCLIQNSGNWKVNVNDIHGYSSTQYALNEKEVFLKKVIELCNDAFDIKHELSGFDLHPAIVSLCSFFEARIKRRVYFNAMDTLSEKQIMVLLGMLKAVFHNAEYKRRVKNRKAAIAKGINSISSMLEHYKVGDEITISRFCLGFYQVYNAEKEARSPQGEDLSEN